MSNRRPALAALACEAIGFIASGRLPGPRQTAVLGFSDLATAYVPTLTTVRMQSRELGCRAGRLLLQRLNRQAGADANLPQLTDMGFQIIERDSA
jgi:LacI family gluconate utilization system Gnt-I transcriptional repressor